MADKSIWPEETKGFVDFHENIIFGYGIPKIGKTTLFSKFSDALFLQTEDGTKHVKVRPWVIRSWAEFCNKVTVLEQNKADCPFKTIVVDTVDNLSTYCDEFVCQQHSLNILGDLDYGKGYSYYTKEFKKQLNRLTNMGFGIVFISHAAEKEVNISSVLNPYAPMIGDLETGKVKMTIPTLERRAMEFLVGLSDMIFYFDINKSNERVIHTQPTKHFEAGDRSGRLPPTVPLDYTELLRAYYGENGQGTAIEAIRNRISKAFEYMAEHQIDGFESATRMDNSIKKHLDVAKLAECTDLPLLQNYLHHLKMKAKEGKPNSKKEAKK